MKDIIEIENYLETNYQFRYNEVMDRIEYKPIQEETYSIIGDREANSILRELLRESFKISKDGLWNLLGSDFVNRHNPFTTYFDQLPVVTGSEHIDQLLITVKTHDDEFFKWAFRKWLVAWVAGMIDPNVINHQCIIMAGTQGIGKSNWLKWLIPEEWRVDYYYAGNIQTGNKDSETYLSTMSLINLDELVSMTYKNVSALKEIVTKSSIKFRKAYGRTYDPMVRRASFAGSVNGREFLYDLTGNRRFLSFEVYEFVNNGMHDVDMKMVLAEAYQLYKSGFQYWFSKEDQQRVEHNNENFMVQTHEEVRLKSKYATMHVKERHPVLYVEACLLERRSKESDFEFERREKELQERMKQFDEPKWLRTEEIYREVMGMRAEHKGELVKFGKLLNKLNFESKRSKDGTCYKVYDIDLEPVLRHKAEDDRLYEWSYTMNKKRKK